MALYYPTVQNYDYIGGTTSEVEILEPNTTAVNYNQFLSNAAASNLILSNIDIVVLNKDYVQAQQPVVLNYRNIDGTVKSIVRAPTVSSKAFNTVIKNIDLGEPFLFNGGSSIDFNILPGAEVQIILKANLKQTSDNIFTDNDLSQQENSLREAVEPEEMTESMKLKTVSIQNLKEPGEEKQIKPVKPQIAIMPLLDIKEPDEIEQIVLKSEQKTDIKPNIQEILKTIKPNEELKKKGSKEKKSKWNKVRLIWD